MLPQSRYSQTPSSPVAHPTPATPPPTESPERTGLVGPRPLLLGSFRNATQSSADSSASGPSSPLPTSRTTRSPTLLSARWSSYTPPLSPVPSFEPSLASEVEMLKAQLAASEAMVKSLTKEKYEAVDAARRFCKKWQTVQAEVEKLKASALDEDDATPEVAPPSEGVWFAGLTTQPPVKNFEPESASCGLSVELKDPRDQQTQGSMEKDEETRVVSPSSEVVPVAGSTNKLQLPKIRIIPPAPLDAESEPVLDSSPVNTATTSSVPTSNYLSPPPRFDSHPTRSQSPQNGSTRGHPQSTSPLVEHETTRSTNPGSPPQASRQTLFNRLGLRVSVPHPIRWLRARRQRELIDLEDPLSETPGRKVHNARMRLLQAQANGPAHSRWVACLANNA
ncbi:hypothetical protein FRC04_006135 [Tulasnella sp. 424]|nr:hypothetical protein FRC04_006135 [Tulasnella sp. 424]